MKKILLALFVCLFFVNGSGTNYNIVNVGITFSPATITITQNDVITFTLASAHDAVEVSLDTWNANGNSPIIGFQVPFGGGTVLGSSLSPGIHYFVCEPHAAFGMKGTITVQQVLAVSDIKTQDNLLIYPSPAKDNVTVQLSTAMTTPVEIKLFNLQGKLVDVLFPKTNFSGLLLRTFQLNKITAPGIYFVQVTTGDNSAFQKIVIM
jgi:plastocyanin